MKQLMMMLAVLMFLLAAPLVAMASSCCATAPQGDVKLAMNHMQHEDQGKSEEMMHQGHSMAEHGDMKQMEHAKEATHDMHGGMAVVDEVTEDGVKGVAKIMTYDAAAREAMAKGGQTATHHLMVYFTDAATGREITSGKAAVKVKAHGDTSSKPIGLMQMGGGFGADVTLPAGHCEIEIGTKLEDGKKRTFGYNYMTK